jgi:chromosome segregation ATPase
MAKKKTDKVDPMKWVESVDVYTSTGFFVAHCYNNFEPTELVDSHNRNIDTLRRKIASRDRKIAKLGSLLEEAYQNLDKALNTASERKARIDELEFANANLANAEEDQQKAIEEQARRIESLEQGNALLMTARADDYDALIKAQHERNELRATIDRLFAMKGRIDK